MNLVDLNKHRDQSPALGKVRLKDAFCETRGFDCGLTGIWRRNDESQKDVAVIEIKEKPFEVRAHYEDFTIIA